MLIRDALAIIIKGLENLYSYKERYSIAKITIEYILNISQVQLSLSLDQIFNTKYESKLISVLKRLQNYEPIQYIIGKVYFLDLALSVNRFVLIPRPETEELASFIIENEKKCKNQTILDIATGSGCIAIAIKKYLSQARVYACDISKEALSTAKINAISNFLDIRFFEADILLDNFYSLLPQKSFDIIISNPPYVLYSERGMMHKNVLNYEPEIALFVGDNNPLLFYNAIADISKKILTGTGRLYLEINERFAIEIKDILLKKGFSKVFVYKDLFGKDRIIQAFL